MKHEANCAYCGRHFVAPRKRLCCNRTCSAKFSFAKKNLDAWSQQEEAWLEDVASTMPMQAIYQKHCRIRKRRGWPSRTQEAIKIKIGKMGLSRKCTLDNFTRYELSRILGVHVDRVRGWVRRGLLAETRIARNQVAITAADFKAFAIASPKDLADADVDGLAWLVGDELAAEIKAHQRHERGFRKPVRCIDTGEVFSGVKAAARAKYVSHGCIKGAIDRGGTSAGFRWEFISQEVA